MCKLELPPPPGNKATDGPDYTSLKDRMKVEDNESESSDGAID
jgi:hypothetical protein